MKLDMIPQNAEGEALARETNDPESGPRTLRSLLMQALANAPIAGWMQVGPGMQRPSPDDPKTILERCRLYDRMEQSNGTIDLGGEEMILIERCVAAEFTVGAVLIYRAMHKKESEDG